MATLNKTIVTGHDATTAFGFDIPRTQHYKNYTVEADFTGLSYPASENDAQVSLYDGEINDDSETETVDYEIVEGGFVKVADGAGRVKVRVVDLNTKNARVEYDPGSADGGTVDIHITFQT